MSGASPGDAIAAAHAALRERPRRWLVTGSAGFIGSHLLEELLKLGQIVTSIDNFATGHRRNLEQVRQAVGDVAWKQHSFIHADITDADACRQACTGVDIVLHEAALGSVPRSIEDPVRTHAANVNGFLNMLVAARDAKVSRFVYAASSSTYGDHPALPKVEDTIGRPLSPYAVSKLVDELYAEVFHRCYGTPAIGLRYFNVFGPRQDPQGAYAAVVPRWASAMIAGQPVVINGDGETSRDFCYVRNVVQANLLAAMAVNPDAVGQVYNVAVGGRVSLKELHETMRDLLSQRNSHLNLPPPRHQAFRAGDVRHSQADIGKAARLLGYLPTHDLRAGLAETLLWYEDQGHASSTAADAVKPRHASGGA